MTRTEHLENIKEHYDKLYEIEKQVSDIFGNEPETKFGECVWNIFTDLAKAKALICGFDYENLDWFIWENRFGAKKFEVKAGKKVFVIDSIKAFIKCEDYLAKGQR